MNPCLRADGTQTRMFPGIQSGDARSVEPDREHRKPPEARAVPTFRGGIVMVMSISLVCAFLLQLDDSANRRYYAQICDNRSMTEYRNSHNHPLADYPHPSVAVDTAVLTVPNGGALSVLIVRTGDGWRLPGTFLHEGERLANAVLRSLQVKAGVTGLSPRQLHVFDDPHRDDRGWVLSVAHLDAVPASHLAIDE